MQLAEVVGAGLYFVDVATVGIGFCESEDLADAGRTRVEVDDTVLVLRLEQFGLTRRLVFDQLLVDQKSDVGV